MIDLEVIKNPADWEALRTEWNQLAGDRLCRRYEWLRAWWDTHGNDNDLAILRWKSPRGSQAFLPLARQRAWIAGDCLVWLGSGKACSDDMGIVCHESDLEEAVEGFAMSLKEQKQALKWDRLDLDGVRADDRGMNLLLNRLTELVPSVQTERRPSLNCWIVPLKETWDSQLATFSKRVRKIVRQCEESHVGHVLEIANTPDQAIEFVRDIETLHQSCWDQRGVPGCFSSPNFTEFVIQLVTNLWTDSKNRPYVGRLLAGEAPIAGSIAFGQGDLLSIYVSGMNPEYSEIRPGWHMNFGMLQFAISQGYRSMDMMRGDEEYKSRLGGIAFAQERWIITAPRWSSQLRGRVYNTTASFKHWATNFYTPASNH